MFQLIFHEEADREYAEAFLWYELQKTELRDEFRLAVSNCLKKLLKNPQFFGFNRKPYREISVNSFPYTIVFDIDVSGNAVYISAIYHTARDKKVQKIK